MGENNGFEIFLAFIGLIILFFFLIYSSSVSSVDAGDNYYIGSYIDEFSGTSGTSGS
jgi:hypothetical protein